jgi:type II secretory pathway component PulJ
MLSVLVAIAIGALELAVVTYLIYRDLLREDSRRTRRSSPGAA